jgi:hypothetical protein
MLRMFVSAQSASAPVFSVDLSNSPLPSFLLVTLVDIGTVSFPSMTAIQHILSCRCFALFLVLVSTMSEEGSKPFFNLDVDKRHVLLDETIALLLLLSEHHVASTTVKDLNFHDDAFGQFFRSRIIYGRPDCAAIPLAYFNIFVVRPRLRNKLKLQRNRSPCLPSPLPVQHGPNGIRVH